MKNAFYLVFMSFFIMSCNTTETVNQEKEAKALKEVVRQWAKAASPEAFFSFIGNDALMMAPDKPILKGHEAIGKVLQEFQSIPGFAITWEPQETFVSASGDLGYSVDLILVTYDGEDGNKVKLFEKGTSVWKKDAKGEWKMAIDVWNVDPTITSIYK